MEQIVRQGAYEQMGMPGFDFLTPEDLAANKGYAISRHEALMATSK